MLFEGYVLDGDVWVSVEGTGTRFNGSASKGFGGASSGVNAGAVSVFVVPFTVSFFGLAGVGF